MENKKAFCHCIRYKFQHGKNTAKASASISFALGQSTIQSTEKLNAILVQGFKAGSFDINNRAQNGSLTP